ncbi:hypothetical protein SBON0708_001428 [Salmonella bongori serovar 48:i:- str. 94-0708]|nr:hypothetical protein [Salmonella bongori serovar 48:i:- str. 94-0708]
MAGSNLDCRPDKRSAIRQNGADCRMAASPYPAYRGDVENATAKQKSSHWLPFFILHRN